MRRTIRRQLLPVARAMPGDSAHVARQVTLITKPDRDGCHGRALAGEQQVSRALHAPPRLIAMRRLPGAGLEQRRKVRGAEAASVCQRGYRQIFVELGLDQIQRALQQRLGQATSWYR